MLRNIISLLALFATTEVAFTQEPTKDQPAKEPQYIEVTVWNAVVVGDGTITGSDKVVSIGADRHTKEEAEEDVLAWKKAHPESLRPTDTRERTLRIPLNKSSSVKPPASALPAKPVPTPGDTGTKKPIRIRGYRVVNGKFERDESLDFESDDYDKASEYYWQIKAREGYSAAWSDLAGRKPRIVGTEKSWIDIGTYNPPKSVPKQGDKSDASKAQPAGGVNKPSITSSATEPQKTSAEEDVSATLLGTKWRQKFADGRFSDFTFERRASGLWYVSSLYAAEGKKLSGGGDWGTFKALKSNGSIIVTFSSKNKNPMQQYTWDGNEMKSKDGTYIIKKQ
jgi:hypothetical protein